MTRALTLGLATLASYVVGFAAGSRVLLPLLNTAPAYVFLVVLLRRGERSAAVKLMLLWAACLVVFGTSLSAAFPERAARVIWNGERYRDMMICWIETGEGEESHPSQFLPVHALHLGAYGPVALLTAGAGSMVMGSLLTNYMDFFVASVALRSSPGWLAGVGAWFPWSLLRVTGYVILGVLLAEPLLRRGQTSPTNASRRGFVVTAVALLVADVVVKSLLAPTWGRFLASLLVERTCSAALSSFF